MTTSSMSSSCRFAVAQQQLDAGADRRLGELHRAHVVLIEMNAGSKDRGALAVDVLECRDADRRCGRRRPECRFAAAPPGHRSRPSRTGRPAWRLPITSILMRPSSTVTRSMAPSAARMPQEMWPPSSAGPDGQEADMMSPRWISEISVLVPISMTRVVVPPRQRSSRGEQRGDVVAADETADVRRQMHIGAGADRQIEFARLDVHGVANGGDERGAAELPHRKPEQQVMHGGIAADRHIDDVGRGGADGQAQIMGERVDRGAGRLAQFGGARPAPGWRGSCG